MRRVNPNQIAVLVAVMILTGSAVYAHGVAARNQDFLAIATGMHPIPYLYLGAKHMVTGYDHLLYLTGVVFFLTRVRDVITFVSLFAIGHSITLMSGVLTGLHVSSFLIDAIIGLSVSYKALENLNVIAFANPKYAVFGFGLVHGLGLSTKLQEIAMSKDGLLANMIFFNLGVEIGQIIGLLLLFAGLTYIRRLQNYGTIAANINAALFGAGLIIFGMNATGYLIY